MATEGHGCTGNGGLQARWLGYLGKVGSSFHMHGACIYPSYLRCPHTADRLS